MVTLIETQADACQLCEQPVGKDPDICEDCLQHWFVTCSNCGERVPEDEVKTVLRDSAHYCRTCVRVFSIRDPDAGT